MGKFGYTTKKYYRFENGKIVEIQSGRRRLPEKSRRAGGRLKRALAKNKRDLRLQSPSTPKVTSELPKDHQSGPQEPKSEMPSKEPKGQMPAKIPLMDGWFKRGQEYFKEDENGKAYNFTRSPYRRLSPAPGSRKCDSPVLVRLLKEIEAARQRS